ncbi:MAG: SGNH/GDSL hydrolase family protein [Lachnospiraceae bacterium]|nr:SGNH/GDSL hydrolase family protein [Lachnospiraceae bacterium]
MKAEHKKEYFIYVPIAAALVLLIVYLSGFYEEKSGYVPDIVYFGDSLIGECRDETSVTAFLSELLGADVFNAGFGGTGYAYTFEDARPAYTKGGYNMAALSASILSDDYRNVRGVQIKEGSTDYFAETLDELSEIDFERVDSIIMGHGLNDYGAGVPIYDNGNHYDTHTFEGAIRTSVRNIRKTNPDIRIIMVTPAYCWFIEEELTCEEFNAGYGVLEDYVECEYRLAEELNFELIDIYHGLYETSEYEDWMKYTNDGLHPNEYARRLMAERIFEGMDK